MSTPQMYSALLNVDGLTPHQRKVWRLIRKGLTKAQTARALGISQPAVTGALRRIKAAITSSAI